MDIGYETIKEIEFENKKPTEHPSAIFVVGQTGSGKTTLIKNLLKDSALQNHIIIDNDRWRPFVPEYDKIVATRKTDEVEEITKYTRIWRNRIFDECVKSHYSLIYHTSLTNVEEVVSQVNQLKQNQYNTSLYILPCNELESRLNNCARYITYVLRQGIW